jgi:hypothetical protein
MSQLLVLSSEPKWPFTSGTMRMTRAISKSVCGFASDRALLLKGA